jgi:carbon storage regulator CsrA
MDSAYGSVKATDASTARNVHITHFVSQGSSQTRRNSPTMSGRLVLSRKIGQSIVISGNIRITIEAVRSANNASVSIEAPSNVPIVRSELLTQAAEDSRKRLAMMELAHC